MLIYRYIVILFCLQVLLLPSQNETNNWHFGKYCGLNFSTNPPTILNNSAYYSQSAGATLSDTAGNLLFYASGSTVWNKSNAVMANGILQPSAGNTQQPIIVKQPGNNNNYFIFYFRNLNWEWKYAEVDISLAAGMGSVTIKDVSFYSPACTGMAAALHCNGIDVWLVIHQRYSSNFRSYLITSSGLSPNAVISASGPVLDDTSATLQIKISPNRKKAVLLPLGWRYSMLFDFHPSTGVISNHFTLMSTNLLNQGWHGGEFSPDCAKLFGNTAENTGHRLIQWNLGAGTPSAIVSSSVLIQTDMINAGLQLARNGKIYIAANGSQSLSVINSPNSVGASCNYSALAQSVSNGTVWAGLPNSISGPLRQKPAISFLTNCKTASLNIPALASGTGYSVTGIQWNFGDPPSGQNVSGQPDPVHVFSSSGTYTVMCVIQYDCGSDTIKEIVNISVDPIINVSSKATVCAGETLTLTASGADTYTWSSGVQSFSSVVSPTANLSLTVSGTSSVTSCTGNKTVNIIFSQCLDLNEGGQDRILFYPNPASNHLNFQISAKTEFKLSDLTGRQVMNGHLEGESGSIDISGLDDGIYLLEAATSYISQRDYIIKQH